MKSVIKSIDRVLLKEHSVKKLRNLVSVKIIMTVLVLWPKLGSFHACSVRVKNAIYTRGTYRF